MRLEADHLRRLCCRQIEARRTLPARRLVSEEYYRNTRGTVSPFWLSWLKLRLLTFIFLFSAVRRELHRRTLLLCSATTTPSRTRRIKLVSEPLVRTTDQLTQIFGLDIWDTAGQESFNELHPTYYFGAHVCIMVFDVTRKVTYTNLRNWYAEMRN